MKEFCFNARPDWLAAAPRRTSRRTASLKSESDDASRPTSV